MLRDFEFLLALVINILVFLFYKKKEQTNEEGILSDEDDFEYAQLIKSLGLASIVLSIIIVAFFLSRNAPLLIEKAWVGVVIVLFDILRKRISSTYSTISSEFSKLFGIFLLIFLSFITYYTELLLFWERFYTPFSFPSTFSR